MFITTDHQSGSTGATEEKIDFAKITGVLWRGKWWIALSMVIAIFLGGYYAYGIAQSQYKTSAKLRIELAENPMLDLTQLVSGVSTDLASLNTEISVLESRELTEALVRRLNLTEDPEFNAELRPKPSFTPIVSTKRMLGLLPPKRTRTPEEKRAREFRKTTAAVRMATSVSIEPDTYVFRVKAVSLQPRKAALIANTLAEIYIESKLKEKTDTAEASISWLSDRVKSLEGELRAQEDEVKELKAETSLISREALEGLTLQAKEFRDRLQAGQELLDTERMELEQLSQAMAIGDRNTILRIIPDPTLRRSATDLADDLSGPEEKRQIFMTRLTQQIQVKQAALQRRETEVASVGASLERLQTQIVEQSRDLQILDQLERELGVTQDLYQTFLTGLQEVSMQVGLVRPDTKIMSRALPPELPFAPRRSIILLLSAFLGIAAAAGMLLLREAMQRQIRTARDLVAATDLPLLGALPMLGRKERQNVLSYYHQNPVSPATEALRNLRTSMLMAAPDGDSQVIMITSTVPAEGKTTLALSLAQNLVGMDKRVLVIEADIRRRPFRIYFPDAIPNRTLKDVIQGTAEIEDAIVYDDRYGLYVMFGEKLDINAADFFSSRRFEEIVDQAREHFDYVIIDTPPVMAVPDARIIARCVDVTLYAVRWNMITPIQLREGLQQFENTQTQISGLVMTQVDARRTKGYGSSYYGYGYGYGTKSYDH